MSNAAKKPNGAMPVIEKGIPMPTGNAGSYAALLRKMEVGDSVVFADIARTTVENRAKHALGRGNYKVRAEGIGFRVWRTA